MKHLNIKAERLRNMSEEKLRERLRDIDATLLRLNMFLKAKGGTNRGELHEIKKEKARILTILGERKLGIPRGE